MRDPNIVRFSHFKSVYIAEVFFSIFSSIVLCKIKIIGIAIKQQIKINKLKIHIKVKISNSLPPSNTWIITLSNIWITKSTAKMITNMQMIILYSFDERTITSLNAKTSDSLSNAEETPKTLLSGF